MCAYYFLLRISLLSFWPLLHKTEGIFLIEADRLLKPGGYFVLTSPESKPRGSSSSRKNKSLLKVMEEFTEKICWSLIAQQDETFIWQKTVDAHCYTSRWDSITISTFLLHFISFWKVYFLFWKELQLILVSLLGRRFF